MTTLNQIHQWVRDRERPSAGGFIRKQAIIGALLLAAALALISGCVTTGASRPAGGDTPAKGTGPSVQRLTDGREGFVVLEVPQLDKAERDKFARAVALLEEQQFEPAAALLEELVALSPNVTAPYIDLAIAYSRLDRPEKAEAQLKTALALFPGHPVASNEYGLLLRKAGKFAEARKIYEQSLEKFPEYAPLHRNLGILCDLYLDDLTCAEAHYGIYSEDTPDDEQVKKWMADLQMRMETSR